MSKKVKMYTLGGKWIVVDGDKIIEYDSSQDAWCFVLLLREIRPKVPCIRSLYPVRSLDPRPGMVKKKIIQRSYT